MAAPALFDDQSRPRSPADLAGLPSLDFEQYDHRHCWDLVGPEAASAQIPHRPRLVTDSAETLHAAALEGLGVVKLGLLVGARDIQAGRLVDVLPGWEPRGGILHAVFPSRRGLLPAVRALLDFLDEQIAEEDFATQEALINAQGTS